MLYGNDQNKIKERSRIHKRDSCQTKDTTVLAEKSLEENIETNFENTKKLVNYKSKK